MFYSAPASRSVCSLLQPTASRSLSSVKPSASRHGLLAASAARVGAARSVSNSAREALRPSKDQASWKWAGGAGLAGVMLLGGLLVATPTQAEAPHPPSEVSPVAAGDPAGELISMDEVAKHNSPENRIWVVIKGHIYDLTDFVEMHPGGERIILKNAGKDVTDIFEPVHPSNAIEENLTPEQFVGMVDPKTIKVTQGEESEAEKKRRIARENMPPPGAMLNLDDFERVAKSILSDQAWAYYSSAGDDETTLRENRNAWGRVWFKPRVLRKISQVDTNCKLVGGSIPVTLPVYISPAAMCKLGHPDGELNLTRAAGAHGVLQGISANASMSLDEILDARKEGQPMIYQCYVNKDRPATERILKKVQEKGCQAVMLTVDAPVMGKREKDMRAKGDVVETGTGGGGSTQGGGGVSAAISGFIDPNLAWEDVKWYRKHCNLPLFLKGIQSVEDVAMAAEHGVQGVILSNHGGRSLDYSRPPLDVLIDLRQQRPDLFNKLEVWVDGGVRRGTDVVKALALGAKAVGLGRPFLFAQSGFGQPGAERAIDIMRDEVERAMRLLGVTSLDQLGPEYLEILPKVFAGFGHSNGGGREDRD